MDLTQLFNLDYLFHPYPLAGFSWPFRIFLLVVFLGAITFAIYAGKRNKKASSITRKGWYKLQVWGWSTGLVGLLLMSFREVRALYFGSRGYLLIWFVVIIVWLLSILIYWKKVIPDKEKREKKAEEFNKWIPKKKK